MRSLDLSTRYYSDAGTPLVTAGQAAEICRVETRTIYKWVARGKLALIGLGEDGEQLFEASDVALLCPVAA